VRTLAGCVAFLFAIGLSSAQPGTNSDQRTTVIVVVGAAGEEEFGKNFAQWAENWRKASQEGGAKFIPIGLDKSETTNDLARLKQVLEDEPKESPAELWLVLIGHGTFDGKEAKFNLRGPDFSATELAAWLKDFRRPLAVIDTSSSSGPFLAKLSVPGRVVITATRSGYEQNYARFGQYLSEAIANSEADLDKDGQTSLLEAYLSASRRVAEFYKAEGRLANEHALLDDNGDGLGTPADWFRGIRAVKKARDGAALDGLRAQQFCLVRSQAERDLPAQVRIRRDELELGIAHLRESKSTLAEDEYYRRLEVLLLELAKLYETNSAPAR
jgi:hypothetical protein